MGRSDPLISQFYRQVVEPKGTTALLGYTNNNWYDGDLYDIKLNNWDINSDWSLEKKYDTIICTRCAYFSKEPERFIEKCYEHLNEEGRLYVDWGLGDHWRFDNYKIGWVKNGEHEYAYGEDNYLWSTVWHDSFLEDIEYKYFEERVKGFGYTDVREAIFNEVPAVLDLNSINKLFNISYNIIALWSDRPQLYILISAIKKIRKES